MIMAVTPLSELEDAPLIRLCLDKQPGALNTLIQRYLKSVYSYIYHTVQNTEMAEDLTQETFLRMVRALHQFDQKRTFKPWLFTIATNVSKTALKKNQSAPLLLAHHEDSALNFLENIADMQDTAAEDAISDEGIQGVLHEALSTLSPTVRQAIILRHVYDLPYEHIADTMNANINTVRTWLKRGRESLKQHLETTGGLRTYG